MGNELLVGPPGSGKSSRLRHDRRVQVFDVRALSFARVPTYAGAGWSSSVPEGDNSTATWADALQQARADPPIALGIDHLECRFGDSAFRAQMLECLEVAIHRSRCSVRIATVRDPLETLRELKDPAPDLERWARLLDSFRKEVVGLATDSAGVEALRAQLRRCRNGLTGDQRALLLSECAPASPLLTVGEELVMRLAKEGRVSTTALVDEIGDAAAYFYRALWDACSMDEQLALRQIAEEGVVNPNNRMTAGRLSQAGLVSRDAATVRLMNESFRRFVLHVEPAARIAMWEHKGVSVPWGSIAAAFLTVAFGLGGLLLLTQQQLVDSWLNYVPAVASAIPSAWKVIAGGPRHAK